MPDLNVFSPEYASKMAVRAKYTGYNVAAPGANTAITGGLKFSPQASVARVTVSLSTGSVFNVTMTDGSTEHITSLNGATALTANCLYTFVFPVRANSTGLTGGADLSYDFEVATDSVIECLFVEEVIGAVI